MQPWARKQIAAALRESRKGELAYMRRLGIEKGKGRYASKKHVFNGYQFGSGYELRVYKDNKLDPNIEILEVHPRFELFPAFVHGSRRYDNIEYTADQRVFVHDLSREEIWEIKSAGTKKAADYALRRNLFLMLNPNVVFREIVFDRKGRRETRTEKTYE